MAIVVKQHMLILCIQYKMTSLIIDHDLHVGQTVRVLSYTPHSTTTQPNSSCGKQSIVLVDNHEKQNQK